MGSILPLLSPGINSTFPPSSSRSDQPDNPAHSTAPGKGTATAATAHRWHSLPSWAKQSCRKHPTLFLLHFMKSARPSCCYTSLPSLYYLYQCTSVTHWTLVPSSLMWNNLLEPFYFSEFLYIIQKQQSLASPKVSQNAFQAPSNLSWIVLSLFYRCK